MRCFLACNFSPESKKLIGQAADTVKKKINEKKIRWVAQENYHLTMVFFDEVSEPRAQELSALTGKALHGAVRNFKIFCQGINFFPRVLFLDIPDKQNISIIYEKIKFLDPQKNRKFIPHLTLARTVKNDFSLRQKSIIKNITLPRLELEITGISLMKSEFSRNGPVYSCLYTFRE
ncbi:MAG TPA: RNA 2',3'-cyclic phosphodiesterase [Spirochaetia bacterium]|nr:RNA 2',3'-cyclic phosphodiesterase [Spirochaetia bacterium]